MMETWMTWKIRKTRTLWMSAVMILVMILMVIAAACQSTPSPAPAQLEPRVKLTMSEAGEVLISVGAYNAGEQRFVPDEDIYGDVKIIDQAAPAEVRARVQVMTLEVLEPGDLTFPGEYTLPLTEEGVYRLHYDLAGHGALETEFTVVERRQALYLKAHPNLINPYTEYTIGDVSLSYQLGDTVELNRPDAAPQG